MARILTKRKNAWTSIVLAFCCAWSAALAIAAAPAPLFVAKLPDYDDALYATVYIDGAPHLFVVDSGATNSVLHSSLRESLGMPISQSTATDSEGSQFKIELFPFPSATIGTVDLTCEACICCTDLTSFREATGRNVEGVLGAPLFRTNIIQLDFDSREFRILDAATPPLDSWGTPIPVVDSDSNHPTVNVAIGDHLEEQCKIDTGDSSSLSLTPSTFAKLGSSEFSAGPDSYTATANGMRITRTGVLAAAKLGPFECKQLRIYVSGPKGNRLGLAFLRRFNVTFDLAHERMYLAKGKAFDRPDDETGWIGIHALRRGGRTNVIFVDEGASADKAGIKGNDEIVAVAETLITDQPLAEVRYLVSQRAQKDGAVDLTICRDGHNQSVTIRYPN